ncbi:hypothetical protein BU15DRAFT_79604 [Melanogaster broomeanus]|nr:hypothetical protein BU15DRAFT_79604 [Melanogaster broomeanus]
MEANKKRQREETEAGSGGAWVPGICCVRCAKAGVLCEVTTDGNKQRKACNRCACMREKCEWLEVNMSRAGKGKSREVPTSPHQGEKKKQVHKVKVQDNEVEIVGENRSGAGPSRGSLDRLVMAIEEMSDRMGELAQVHRESMQVHWESTQASRKARRAFVDEAAICGALEEPASKSEEEEVDEGEIDEDMAGLEEDVAENPMSPPAV